MTSAAHALVDHALAVDWTKLSSKAQQASRTFLHDTLCVGIAGRNAAYADTIVDIALSWGGRQDQGSPLLGRPGLATSPSSAAFINAFQIHSQEYDCVHEEAVAHPLATVLAALLGELPTLGPVDGATFLAAMVAGVDVVAELGVAARSPLKFFRPATAGVFGSVAAIARLRQLDRETTLDAFGHALAFTSGTMQAHVEGKPSLALQVAAAARSAVQAIDLARAGLPGVRGSIDGKFGYFALFEDQAMLDMALLGSRERITELSWKPFPTGRAAHGAIVALQTMCRDENLSEKGFESFVYRAPPLIARLVGRRPHATMDIAYARLCFAYLGAVTLRRGTVGLGDFSRAAMCDPVTLDLAERFFVEADDNSDVAAFVPARAKAVWRSQSLLQDVTHQYGSPAWPLSRKAHFTKARACLAFGDMQNAEPKLAVLFDSFDQAPDAFAALAPAFG